MMISLTKKSDFSARGGVHTAMESMDFYVRFVKNELEARDYASELQGFLAEEAARQGIPLSMEIEAGGQDLPKLKVVPGDHAVNVMGWLFLWAEKNPTVTAFAETLDGSTSIQLSLPETKNAESPRELSDSSFRLESKVDRPRGLRDSDFRMEFKPFDRKF
jgi:hypothetical protein